MDSKIIIGILASVLIGLMSWNLKTTYNMSGDIIKLQQGQVVLSEQIKRNTNFIKKQMKKFKKPKKKKKKKNNEG